MLTSRYMTSVKNLPAIMEKIVDGTAPPRFTVAHLKGIGFKTSNDQAVLPLLKELGFLASDGAPTKRYHDYRDKSRSKLIMGEAIKEAYEDLFHINEKPSDKDRSAIEGRFKSTHNASDVVAGRQASTFLALLKLADLDGSHQKSEQQATPVATAAPAALSAAQPEEKAPAKPQGKRLIDNHPFGGLRYNIEIHLPATKDVEVYNAIFKSLREHLIDE